MGIIVDTVYLVEGQTTVWEDYLKPFELHIKIVNPKTKDYFIRSIRDVTYFENRYIITWDVITWEE